MSSGRNNCLSKMFFILFLCILTSGSLSSTPIQTCSEDGECLENYYCYTQTNECAPCIPNFCGRYHRIESWKKCTTHPSDCGACLPGYEEEVLSDGSNREPCILSHQHTTAQAMGYQNVVENGPSNTYLSGFIGLPLFILIVGFFVYTRVHSPLANRSDVPHIDATELEPMQRQCNHGGVTNSNNIFIPSAPKPPEYFREESQRSFQNVYLQYERPLSDPFEHRVELKQCSSGQLLQSAVFRRPDYEEENLDNVIAIQDQEVEEVEDPDSQEVEDDTNRGGRPIAPPIQYHDENTMPSDWTPGPLQFEEDNTSLPTDTHTMKRPSTEMGSSESEDEQNPKRLCDNGTEEETEPRSSSILPNLFRNFTTALSSIRQNTSSANNTQNINPNVKSDSKDN